MKSDLFNQEAVDSLSTPEQLDQREKIISPGIWVLFSAVMIGATAALVWFFVGTISSGTDYEGVIFDHNNVLRFHAKGAGIIQDVLTDEGERVSEGDILAVLSNEELVHQVESLREQQKKYKKGSEEYQELAAQITSCSGKMILRSTANGTVQSMALAGTSVEAGDVVATVVQESQSSYQEVYIYVPKDKTGALQVGMEAQITPSYVTREEYGYMEGVISDISENIVSENHILKHMGTTDYVEQLMDSGNCVEVTIQLSVDEEDGGSYVWSNPKGKKLSVESGERCRVHLLKKEYHPYELLAGW